MPKEVTTVAMYFVADKAGNEIYESNDLFACLHTLKRKPHHKLIRRSDGARLAYTGPAYDPD